MAKEIFSINSRSNVLLEVIFDSINKSAERMNIEINAMYDMLIEQLNSKGIDYSELKPALVPHKKKKEIVIAFDSSQINDDWYGPPIVNKIISAFDKKTVNSFRAGDYIGDNANQPLLKQIIGEHIDLSTINYRHSDQIFLVYINNVSDKMKYEIETQLKGSDGFIGIIDVSFSSLFKDYISTILVGDFIKYKDIIIGKHEDGEDNDDNYFFYDFERYGFKNKNILNELYGVFLNYKIERRYYGINDKVDQTFSLNAISSQTAYLENLKVVVTDAKLEYFKNAKKDTFERIGLLGITKEELMSLIKSKIDSNYIYCMKFTEEYNLMQFNIMLEFVNNNQRYKIALGLKYDIIKNEVFLLTMF